MIIVRLDNNIVVETLPEATYEQGIAYWYGEEFAAQCAEAPEDVKQGMVYDAATGGFFEPADMPPEPTAEERLAAAESAILALMEVLTVV